MYIVKVVKEGFCGVGFFVLFDSFILFLLFFIY